jgi:DNA end-binding protein Ku
MIATLLNFDYKVRSAAQAFDDIPSIKIQAEMIDLAEHIIKTKRGRFDPTAYKDRYEAALAELVNAKLEGKPIKPAKPTTATNVVDLMEALRRSAAGAPPKSRTRRSAAGGKRKPAAKHPSSKRAAARKAS